MGVPVLFIPGNAGSSRQVRSIASSASHQYYPEPYTSLPEFLSSGIKPLDFFAGRLIRNIWCFPIMSLILFLPVEFNEDFSALHGPTLLSERSYTSSAITYILSLYPPGTQVILMGHSMGGIVALSLLPSPNISAIITMSTPHALPPARLDKRIEDIYSASWSALRNASTPILSICGGATDLMIPSETCSMEQSGSTLDWRKTVFTTCMEGAWTGVGHREMVWCHQVRWRVARAAIELGSASGNAEKGAILARWFRDEVDQDFVIQSDLLSMDNTAVTHIPPRHRLVLRDVSRQSDIYLLPLSPGLVGRFILYVSRGIVGSLSPHHFPELHVSVYRCRSTPENCLPLRPRSLRLIPNPPHGTLFPIPEQGADESDGVVRFDAIVDCQNSEANNVKEWIGVAVRGDGDSGSWIVGGIEQEHVVLSKVSKYGE